MAFDAVAIIYFEQVTNSSVLASLVFSIYALVQSFSEIPTGIVSDKWSRKKLRELTLLQAMNHGWSSTTYRLNSLYYNLFFPVWTLNFILFIYNICTSIGFYFAIYLRKIRLMKMGFVSSFLRFIITFIGLLLNNIVSPFILPTSSLATGGEGTTESTLLQKEFDASQRTTQRSFTAIIGGIFTAVLLYIFGLLADIYSIYISLCVLLGYKFIVLLYYAYLMRQFAK